MLLGWAVGMDLVKASHFKKDAAAFKTVWRRGMGMIRSLETVTCKKTWPARKPELGWFHLEKRMSGHERQRLQIWKSLLQRGSKEFVFQVYSEMTEGNSPTLKQRRFGPDVDKNFLTVKTLKLWKELSVESLESPSLNTFENRLGKLLSKIMWIYFLAESNPLAVTTLIFWIDFKKLMELLLLW